MRRAFVWVAAALTIAAAHPDAASLFKAGQFAAAGEAGRAEHTAQGLAVAARATLTRAAFLTTDRDEARALTSQGEADAEAAIKLDPHSYDAAFQRASALGYRATLANSSKLATQTKTIFTGLTKSNPARPEAWLGLGAWNGEAVDNLGRFMAGMVLGAKLSAMDAAFAEAERRMPNSPVPFAYHGCLVLRITPEHSARATVLLRIAVRNRAGEAYEAVAQRGAADVLAQLQKGDVASARALAKKLGSFGRLS